MPRGRKKVSGLAEENKKDISIEEDLIKSETLDEEFEEPEIAPKEEKIEYKDSDLIKCHSVIVGGLTITCKSGNYYYFSDYGAEMDIEYKDLVELIKTHSEHLYNPRIVVDDANVVNSFRQLKEFYDSSYSLTDLRIILGYPVNKMVEIVSTLPEGVKDNLRSIAAEMISSGELDSLTKIKALDKIYDTDMTFLASLSER